MVAGSVASVHVVESATGAGEARRTPRHVRRGDVDLFQLFVHVRGEVVGEHAGRRSVLRPGDVSLTDLSRPFVCRYSTRRSVLLSFPPALLPLGRSALEPVMGARIPGDSGTAALVSTLARQLPRHLDDDGAGGSRLAGALLDLLTATLAARLDRPEAVPGEVHRRALRARVAAYVEARLGDPDLDPAAVAQAHHISLRYLHKLFEDQEHTVAGLIRQRRLERVRRDLLDPALVARPVHAIAARSGFVNAAHFTRVFRGAFGVPPAEYRRVHGVAPD